MKDRKRVSVGAAVAAVLALTLSYGPRIVVGRALGGLAEHGASWLPTFGTLGQTATFYGYVSAAAVNFGVMVPGFVLGYALAQRRDVRRDFREVAVAIVTGSTAAIAILGVVGLVGIAVSGLASGGSVGFGWLSPWTVSMLVVAAVRLFAEVVLVVTVTALAGIAVATFGTDSDGPDGNGTDADVPHAAALRDT